MKNIIDRPQYLDSLIAFKDKKLIKVVSGIRRCGKSTLFDLYCNYLKDSGVDDVQIIRVNLESGDFYYIKTYEQLYEYIADKLVPNQKNYVFID